MNQLILIRGLPGSGKSTLARILFQYYTNQGATSVEWVEADQYFINANGQYNFDPKQIGQAHDYCERRAVEAMKQKTPYVIVSNTFTRNWEMHTYVEAAKAYDYQVQVYHCEGQFKGIHDVPQSTQEKMKHRWEKFHRES